VENIDVVFFIIEMLVLFVMEINKVFFQVGSSMTNQYTCPILFDIIAEQVTEAVNKN